MWSAPNLSHINNMKEKQRRQIMTILSNTNNEKFPNNFIDKNLQSILKPLNVMQAVFFCAKYKIRDNFIYPNSVCYNFVSLIGSMSILMLSGTRFVILACHTHYDTFAGVFRSVIEFVLVSTGHILNYYINVRHNSNNVVIVLKIQRVFREIKCAQNRFKYFHLYNWMNVIIVNCFYILWIYFCHYSFDLPVSYPVVSIYLVICFDLNLVYASRTVKLVRKILSFSFEDLGRLESIGDLEDNYWNKMFKVFMDIFEAYQLVVETFRLQVMFFVIHTFSHALLLVNMYIEINKNAFSSSEAPLLLIMPILWVAKNIFLVIYLSVECEKFYSALKNVRCFCILGIRETGCSDGQRRFCKNIQRVQNACFKKMSACGLFVVDGALPLRLCSLIMTYTIVILQFAFL